MATTAGPAAEGLKVVMEADGGARGNPGPAGYGAVVRDAGTGEVLAERAEAIGVATNNVAEYSGLIAGLQAAADLGAARVAVRMDSKLVVEQMCGRWQIKHPGLRPLAAQAAALVSRFDRVTFDWIPRERNKHADRLANEAMDAAAGGRPVPAATSAPAGGSGGPGGGSGDPGGGSGDPGGGSARAAAAAESTRPASRGSWAPPDTPPVRLLLIRHGETALNRQGRYSGRVDVALTEHGLAQARATAARVAALAPELTAVVSSPLSRCARTAEMIATATGAGPVLLEPDLTECDFGEWEGRTFAEVRADWPDRLDTWLADPGTAPPGGESFQQVGARVAKVVERLCQRPAPATIAVVSHVSPIKLILRDALGATDALLYRLYLDSTGISVVDFWPDGGVAVRAVNDTAHLPVPAR